jgi:hypothetical protein
LCPDTGQFRPHTSQVLQFLKNNLHPVLTCAYTSYGKEDGFPISKHYTNIMLHILHSLGYICNILEAGCVSITSCRGGKDPFQLGPSERPTGFFLTSPNEQEHFLPTLHDENGSVSETLCVTNVLKTMDNVQHNIYITNKTLPQALTVKNNLWY